jgi:hypothetical protein
MNKTIDEVIEAYLEKSDKEFPIECMRELIKQKRTLYGDDERKAFYKEVMGYDYVEEK